MGQDMYHLSRDIAIMSHGGLVSALTKAREQLHKDGPKKYAALIQEIDKALANARIT